MTMRGLISRAGAFLLLLGLPSPAHAQLRSPAFSFDLDVPAGNYSEWVLESPETVTGVSATIVFKELRPKDRWLPSFIVWVGDSAGNVTLRLSPEVRKGPLVAHLEQWTGTTRRTTQSFRGTYKPGQAVSFELHWTPDGKITGIFEGDTLRTQYLPAVRTLGVSTSSGQVKTSRFVYLTKP